MKKLVMLALPLWLCGETLSLYNVPKMHCALCTVAVKKSLKGLEGVHRVEVRLNTKQAKVWHDDNFSEQILSEAIAKTGYEGILISRERINAH